MACRGFWECLLKLLNFLLTVSGLAMIGYGIYLLVLWNDRSSSGGDIPAPVVYDPELLKLGRPMLAIASFPNDFFDNLPKAWFIYLFIGVGAVLFVISCFGCIGAATRNGCCLSCYAFLVFLLILAEFGFAAFIYFDHEWRKLIPEDKTGVFDMIYGFLDDNWDIVKWVAVGIVVLEFFAFLFALITKAANSPPEYDSDDEYIAPRSTVRQPLISRQAAPVAGVPIVGALDQRPSRNDAWSARMREKYGLDTSEYTYNPSDPSRLQQATAPAVEERRGCTIM